MGGITLGMWLVALWCALTGGEKNPDKLAMLDRLAFGPTPEMFAEYREPGPGCKAIERRIALAWLALLNARRNREWVRAAELEFGMIPRLEDELEDLRRSAAH